MIHPRTLSAVAPGAWLVLAAATILLAVGMALGTWPVLRAVHENWSEVYGPFAHGYLILLLSVWLAIRLWPRESGPLVVRPAWWALGPLLLLLGALLLLEWSFINSPRQVLLPLLLLAATALVFGTGVARRLFWPILFLYFALPQWWPLNTPLQSVTTVVVNILVSLSGIPAYVEGNHFLLPAGVVEIASGCSGLNYLIVGLALAAFQAMLFLREWRSRLLLCAVACAVALLSNWLRVFILVLIAYATDMQHYLIRVDHLYFGWALFLVMMWPVMRFGARLEERESVRAPEAVRTTAAGGFALAPMAALMAALLCAALLSALPWLLAAPPPAAVTAHDDAAIPGLAERASNSLWNPVFPGAINSRRAYAWQGDVIDVYRGRYPAQTREAHLAPGSGDLAGGIRDMREIRPPDVPATPSRPPFLDMHGVMQQQSVLVRSWYRVGGRFVASPAAGRWVAPVAALSGRRDADVVALLIACQPDCAAAAQRAAEFATANAAWLWPDPPGMPDRRP